MLRRVCARSVFVALLSGLLTFNALAAENSTVFEERLYVRERGALVTETDHFRINTPKGDYTLKISNGGDYQGQSYDPVTSATLRVNGVTVAGPDAFRQNEPYLERTLALTANENRIEVTLGGKPGGGYRVTITGFENYEPLIRSQPVTGWTDNLDYRYPVVAEDPDDDPLSYSFIEAPPGMTINAGSGLITWAPAATGTFEVTVAVSDGVGGVARQHYALTVTDGTPPVVTPPADIVAEATATETPVDLGRASALDQYDGPLTPTADPTGPFAPGNHTVTWSATDSAGNTGTARQAVTVRDTTPPSLILPDNIITVSDEPVAVDLGHPATSDLFEPVTLSHDAPALFPLGETQVTWTATDANGNTATDSQWVIVEHPDPVGELPPDPTDVAPPLDNPNTSLLDATAFLYTGTNSIQTGVAEGTIEERRAAVIRGRVLDRDNTPLAGVTVTIKGHNEFGQTLSRADGWFDMVVNGGGTLVIDYQKAGYLPVQRQVRPQWNDYAFAEDIVMIPLDSQVSTVQLGNGEAMQVARGSSQTDADGTRQATVLFPEGTTASITLADGSTQSLTTLNVRATEYTVGENGPQAMPGDLPPTSGYTYAVELSVDEAVSAGATRVDFSQPLPVYVDNFIGFPTGAIVPAGWYDRGKAAWIPAKNGRVIEITGISNARAELDIDGSGLAAGGSALAELGIDGIEREKLASLYSPGTTLWRVPVSHFTPWDYNWPYGPSDDAIPPPDTATPNHDATPPEPSDCDTDCGSIIESQSRVLAENIRVSGTPYTLNYRSDRQLGHSSQTKVTIPVIGNDIPDSLMIASVYVDIAGKRHTYHYKTQNPSSYDASTDHDTLRPNTSIELEWNGQDSYGREIGYAKAEVRVTYHYKPQYYPAQDEFEASFGEFGNASPGSGWNSRSGSFITIASNYSQALVNPGFMQATMPASLGGWTLDAQHYYSPETRTVYNGNGNSRNINEPTIQTLVWNGGLCYQEENEEDHGAQIGYVEWLDADSQGNIYFTDYGLSYVGKLTPQGYVDVVTGQGTLTIADGLLATDVDIDSPSGIAVDKSGNVYISEYDTHSVWRISPDGIIHAVAGNGQRGYSGDGGDALAASFNYPKDLAVNDDGAVYIADSYNNVVRKVSPNGMIHTVAGNGARIVYGDAGLATKAGIGHVFGIDTDSEGNLYFTASNTVRKVNSAGIISTLAGDGIRTYSGDGGLAIDAQLDSPWGIKVDSAGNIYTVSPHSNRIRKINTLGYIDTIAGGGALSEYQDGRTPSKIRLALPTDLVLMNNNLIFSETLYCRIRSIDAQPLTQGDDLSKYVISSGDGAVIYEFDQEGIHLRTIDAMSGIPLYSFEYDADKRLANVIDRFGNVTYINRYGDGTAYEIVAPAGQVTSLGHDAYGYLNNVTGPTGNTFSMNYSNHGLLTGFTDPNGNSSTLQYDADGRLISDKDILGSGWELDQNQIDTGYEVVLTSSEGRQKTYQVEYDGTGNRIQTNIRLNGTEAVKTFYQDGSINNLLPDGTRVSVSEGIDGRFGVYAPIPSSVITLPSGLTKDISNDEAVVLDATDPSSVSEFVHTATTHGRITSRAYTAGNNTWVTTSPLGRSVTTQLNTLGMPSQTAIPGLASVNYHYDEQGRIERINRGAENSRNIQLGYDSFGYLATVTDVQGQTVNYANDAAGRLIQQTNPDGATVEYEYDANGNLTDILLPGGDLHSFNYTVQNKKAAYNPPSPNNAASDAPIGSNHPTTLYQYNLDRQLEAITRPDGAVIDYVYDDTTGQLTDLIIPEGRYVYDYYGEFDPIHSGRLKTVTAPGGQQTGYEYDGFLLTGTNWNGAVSGTLAYEYNHYFEPISQTLNGEALSLSYNADSQLLTAGDFTLAYVAENGLLAGTTLDNLSTRRDYTLFGELESDRAVYGNTALYDYQLYRDEVGRITGKAEMIGAVTLQYEYGYDDSNRLEYVKENGTLLQRWQYDANGNRTHENGVRVAQYDAQDRLIHYNQNEYRYTANGELTEKTNTDTNGTTQFDYDAFSNLRQVTLPDGTNIEYLIDGQNRRVGKLRNGTLEQGFLYQGQLNPVAELDGNNQITARFVYGEKRNVPSYMIKDSTNYRIVSDHLGSVRLVVNASTGEVQQRMDYDAWGNVTQDTNPGFQPFGYAGGIYDRDTGLARFGARDYDPEIGRWTTKDPVGFGGGLNHYAYANNGPVIYIDPTGNIGLIGAAYGGVAGGIGGFISGGWQGAIAGAGAGALIGSVNVFGASAAGSAAGAGVASLLGQAAGNVVAGKDYTAFCNYDLSAAAGAALGGAIGGPLGQSVGKYFPVLRYPIIGRPLSSNGFNQVPGNTAGAVVEGVSVGIGELGGQRL